MASQQDTLNKIRQFAESNRKLEEERANHPIDHHAYNRQLDQTLKQLQDQVKRQEYALQELHLSTATTLPSPGLSPHARLAQTRRATKAYNSLSQTDPVLPPPDSPLSPLLALRETFRQILDLKSSISTVAHHLSTDRERLKAEEAALSDARLISTGLDERIRDLQTMRAGDREKAKAPTQLAKEVMQQQRRRKVELEKKTTALREALTGFVDEHLASMLAAEDLGGPVVGDQIDVPDWTLEAGYTAHGKEKKATGAASGGGTTGAGAGRESRQQRIDEFVRRRSRGRGDGVGDGNGDDDDQGGRVSNKREAAGAEMHSLLDSLLEVAETSSYIELEQETAASRFLVKAKIAQFHPRDARRLRLIDFARELVD
ncbi:hypothetical protein PAAG_01096 [Paracoccidioides lutzii Pb01]|uniref:Uncharacterized protein n=1 Tax=Paracoccidioides lutzii (strain ATCC MYA-826 / Pb01) TaxID=502779 RepID=C1GRF1_PARBA|nr:hypothetical protein PAAG_01096 [Paracoccidioides lutzii Pb01]EEH38175.1 hypothetical protein PAAG_01096 [Paracoccidioides lutzii Pb01]